MNLTNIDLLQHNKLSVLHNGKTIFFCKTDFLQHDFQQISQIDNEVVLISGNSDYAITDDIVNMAPANIKKWYAVNAISHNPKIQPLPLGLENENISIRDGHGIGYPERAKEKEIILRSLDTNHKPLNFLYANFSLWTNPNYRTFLKNLISKLDYCTQHSANLSLRQMFNEFLNHKMVLCPAGNGIDTHRLWEVLYSNRIPVTIKTGDYKIYQLYEELPIIILQSPSDLMDYELLNDQYNQMICKKYNFNLLSINYWINRIKNHE